MVIIHVVIKKIKETIFINQVSPARLCHSGEQVTLCGKMNLKASVRLTKL